MAPRLLLDAHLSPIIAGLLRERGIEAVSLQEWRGGHFFSRPDIDLLEAATGEGLTLVSFDVGTIPILLRELAESEVAHSGVILISSKTFRPQAFRPLADAIVRYIAASGDQDWQNRVEFLPK